MARLAGHIAQVIMDNFRLRWATGEQLRRMFWKFKPSPVHGGATYLSFYVRNHFIWITEEPLEP